MYLHASGNRGSFRRWYTGDAWLSSARGVSRLLKCSNERNPYRVLYITRDCRSSRSEEGGDDVKSARPLHLGRHTSYNGENNGSRRGNPEPILQISPQFRLRAETRPHEVGIGSNRRSADCGEYVLTPCTHCPSNEWSWQCPKRMTVTRKRAAL